MRLWKIIISIIMMFLFGLILIENVHWDLLNENWNEIGDWEKQGVGTSEIDPEGQLHQDPNPNKYVGRLKDIGELPSVFTVEVRFKIDVYDNPASKNEYSFRNGEHYPIIQIFQNNVRIIGDDPPVQDFNCTTEIGEWYVWRIIIDSNNDLAKVYQNGIFIGERYSLDVDLTNDGEVEVGNYYGEVHEDYIRIASGLHPPPTHDNW